MHDLIFCVKTFVKIFEEFNIIVSSVVNRGGQHVVSGRFQAIEYTITLKNKEKSIESSRFLCFSWSELQDLNCRPPLLPRPIFMFF